MQSIESNEFFDENIPVEILEEINRQQYAIPDVCTNFRKMGDAKLRRLISGLTHSEKDRLNVAFKHYVAILDITDVTEIPAEEIKKDRVQYCFLIKQAENGLVIFDDVDCANFMAKRYDLSIDVCAAYVCCHNP